MTIYVMVFGFECQIKFIKLISIRVSSYLTAYFLAACGDGWK